MCGRYARRGHNARLTQKHSFIFSAVGPCPHAFGVLMRRGEDLTKQTLSKQALDPRIEKEVPPNVPPRKRGFQGT
jgi:hypothetical protein